MRDNAEDTEFKEIPKDEDNSEEKSSSNILNKFFDKITNFGKTIVNKFGKNKEDDQEQNVKWVPTSTGELVKHIKNGQAYFALGAISGLQDTLRAMSLNMESNKNKKINDSILQVLKNTG